MIIFARRLAAVLLAGSAWISGAVVVRAGTLVPVPNVIIYPGQVIGDGMLTERDLPDEFAGRSLTVMGRDGLVGKTARHTLLPGLPIGTNAVGDPKVVNVGALVRVIFSEGGLTITTYCSALQSGAVGDTIPVRNLESGLTISGTIERDGSIRLSNS